MTFLRPHCRREAYRLDADVVMSLEDIFGYICWKTTNLDKTWKRAREWGKSDPVKFLARLLQKPQRKGQHTNLLPETRVLAQDLRR